MTAQAEHKAWIWNCIKPEQNRLFARNRIMKKTRTSALIILLLLVSAMALTALDTGIIIAYPVPFNPKKDTLKIGESALTGTFTGYNLKAEISDINGDPVRTLTGSSPRLVWNGRNNNGNYVKPGLYIIKVTAENSSGDYGKKIIRILVDY